MSERYNGNTGWEEEGGEVVPSGEGEYPYPDGVQSQINSEVVKTDPEYEVHTRRNDQPSPNPTPSKPFELPGQNTGRSNTGGLPTPGQVRKGMPKKKIVEQQEINEAGADEARNALGLQSKPPKTPKGEDDEPENRPRLF